MCGIIKDGGMNLVSLFCVGVKCVSKMFCSIYVGVLCSILLLV